MANPNGNPGNKGQWLKDAEVMLDQERIMKQLGMKNTDDTYKSVLHALYDNITTDGFKVTPGMDNFKLRRSVAKLHRESRIMHFKGAEDFINYQKAYGDENYYESMMSYMDRMSKEVAAMQKFGPNPDYVVGQMITEANNALEKAYTEGRISKYRYGLEKLVSLENMYSDIMGRTMAKQNGLATTFQILRNVEYIAKLGFATISALTDVAYMSAAATMASPSITSTLIGF